MNGAHHDLTMLMVLVLGVVVAFAGALTNSELAMLIAVVMVLMSAAGLLL